MKAKVEILCEAIRPGIAPEGLERSQPGELAVATQADRAHPIPSGLSQLAEAGELEVLATRDQAVGRVADDHAHLHAADPWIREQTPDLPESVRLQMSVSVDNADHDLFRVEALDDGVSL